MLRWLWVVPLTFATAAIAAGDAEPPAERATWVATRTLARAPYELSLPAKVGVLEAAERRELAFQVQGRLGFLAEEGTTLAAGEPIAVLDTELAKVRVRQAEIRLAEARSEAARVRGLRKSNAASAKVLESTETNLALRHADLAAAREELAQRSLLAPFDGIVAETQVEVDEVVAPGRTVAVFLQKASLEVEVALPGYQVSRVVVGAKAHVAVPALRNASFEGVVDRVAPAARGAGHLFPVTIRLSNEEQRMRPGMTARVRIITDELPAAAVAPLAVAVERAGRRTIFFVVDGRAEALDVHEAALDGSDLVITAALPSHELVVRGQRDLGDGVAVRVDDSVLGADGDPGSLVEPEVRGPLP